MALCGAAALALAMLLPGSAEAQGVAVVRGSEVGIAQGPEVRRGVVLSPRVRSVQPSPRAWERPPRPVVMIVVSIQDTPRTAWLLFDPWETDGIRVHGMR